MKTGKFNVVVDGQWGSCGKGKTVTSLADKFRPEFVSTTNMPNAGHTAVWDDGRKFVAKSLPVAAILRKWIANQGYKPTIILGASSAFRVENLLKEVEECLLDATSLWIHERSGVMTDRHAKMEMGQGGTKHIASTMQGCGAFLAEKIMRGEDVELAGGDSRLRRHIFPGLSMELNEKLSFDETILHEGAQGFSLDISHGSHYPFCTSRGTTATQNMADMGINPRKLGDIYLVIRPFPIRVGNVVEGGKMVGYSGDCYEDQEEMKWADVGEIAGVGTEEFSGELTTVTKRLRRVFSFSKIQLREAVEINGANKLVLNFADYLDWNCRGCDDWENLPNIVLDFIGMCEGVAGIPVVIVGTGAKNGDTCWRNQ
ncbi:hypothetical protein LCGC14_0249180 [marine sediment metagenome]|uniref:Adenylosuccinate synthetase n=1 Tax=marine sediment metagenome TaxID=412755 RepID=A0A0F9U555_9ZZZZ